jgi:hypothetical protein
MQTPPAPPVANARPVRSCESLTTVALPNTTIESASVDGASPGTCRVVATTTHPPAGDTVRIWIAMPMSNWNGRFLGTGPPATALRHDCDSPPVAESGRLELLNE